MANLKTLAPIALLLGCSGSAEDESSFTCDVVADRDGTYLMEFETLGGTCPDQEPALVRLDASAETPAGCVELSPPEASDAGCTLEVRRVCDASSLMAGWEIETTAITTQQDDAGTLITGTLQLTVRDDLGTLCSGTFRVTATRQ